MSSPDHVKVNESLIDLFLALCQLFYIPMIVHAPVTQLLIIAGLFKVGGLSDQHLAHFVDEEGLLAGQQSQDGCGLQPLPRYELFQVHFLVKFGLSLD